MANRVSCPHDLRRGDGDIAPLIKRPWRTIEDERENQNVSVAIQIASAEGKRTLTTNGVTYRDTYVRRADGWKIAKRISCFTWSDNGEMLAGQMRKPPGLRWQGLWRPTLMSAFDPKQSPRSNV